MPPSAWPRLLPPAASSSSKHVHVVDAGAQQRARRGQAGDAGADDDHAGAALRAPARRARLRAAGARRRWPRSVRRADPAAVEAPRARRVQRAAAPPSAAARSAAHARRAAHAGASSVHPPHSSSKVCTSTWFDSRFTSAGTRAMSGGKSNSARQAVDGRGSAGPRAVRSGSRHGPAAGDARSPIRRSSAHGRGTAWRVRPTASIVATTVQKLLRAISGEVVCTTA